MTGQTVIRSTIFRFLPICMALAGAAGSATASTGDGKFAIRGLGGVPCDVLVKEMDGAAGAATSQRVSDWMTGYLSGANQGTPDTFDLVSVQDNGLLVTLLASVCRQNPKASVQIALAAIIGQFQAIQNHGESELLTLKSGTEMVQVRAESLAVLQQGLAQRGLMEPVAKLGVFDPATQDAIAAFQKARKLPVSGLPDDRTVLMFLSGK